MNAKPFLFFLLVCLFSSFLSLEAVAADTPANDNATTLSDVELKVKINTLAERVQTLKEAKKNAVSKVEKKQIRHEIRDIKKEAKALKQQVSGGVYIGTGVLLVALLLILLL